MQDEKIAITAKKYHVNSQVIHKNDRITLEIVEEVCSDIENNSQAAAFALTSRENFGKNLDM